MAEFEETFEALPPELEAPEDPDTELAATDEDPQPLEVPERATPTPLGRTYAYDFIDHRLIPNDAGGPLMIYGLDSLGQWVEKCLRTPRGVAPAVDPEFGIETVNTLLDGGPFDASAAAELEDMVREALTFHPRISDIDEWEVDYEPGDDAVTISFRVLIEDEADVENQELAVEDFPLPLAT